MEIGLIGLLMTHAVRHVVVDNNPEIELVTTQHQPMEVSHVQEMKLKAAIVVWTPVPVSLKRIDIFVQFLKKYRKI